jgi:Golgi nucleoside diphosphatase
MKKVVDYFQKGDEDEEEDFLAMKLSQAFEELRNGKMYEFPVLQTASMKPIQLDPQKVIKAEKLLSQEDDD